MRRANDPWDINDRPLSLPMLLALIVAAVLVVAGGWLFLVWLVTL